MAAKDKPNDTVNCGDSCEGADEIIRLLKQLMNEYDALIEEAESNTFPCVHGCGRKTPVGNENVCAVEDVLEAKLSLVENTERQRNMHKMIAETYKMKRELLSLQKKRKEYEMKFEELKRACLEEERSIESVKLPPLPPNKVFEKQELIRSLKNDLLDRGITEELHVTSIVQIQEEVLELQSRYDEIQAQVRPYAGLPPNRARAKEKLAEANEELRRLCELIRKALTS